MKNYLLTIILTSICVSFANIISPTHSAISKYIKAIGALIILCVIITSLTNVVKMINDDFFNKIKDDLIIDKEDEEQKYNDILKDYLNTYSKTEIIKETKSILKKEFQIPEDEATVELYTDFVDDKMTLCEIKIVLSGKSIFKNPYNIEKRFNDIWKCKCTVLIK